MNSKIFNILKPKSKAELYKDISLNYNVPEKDVKYVLKIISMIPIVDIKTSNNSLCGNVYKFMYMDVLNPKYDNNTHMQKVCITLKIDKILINKQIENWKKIYDEVIKTILKNAIKENFYTNKLHYICNAVSGLISIRTRTGLATFVIANKKMSKEILKQNINSLIRIENNAVGDNIIIGRKVDAQQLEPGFILFKHNNCYKLYKNNLEKLYICIDYKKCKFA
jgi:hypothetical protein